MRWLVLLLLAPITLSANEAKIIHATAECNSQRICGFKVTVHHADTGWEHYADGWEIWSPNGEQLGRRTLLHPHIAEQPFTRSLSGVLIPAEMKEVEIRVHDSVHGFSDHPFRLIIPSH